jgi:hypothetical protein
MPGGCRVEDDMVPGLRAVGQQGRKLVEGGDLRRAGSRQLLPHRRQFLRRRSRFQRRQHALTVRLGGIVGIDVQHRQAGRPGDRYWRVAQLDAEHLIEVRGRIGADEEHLLAGVGQRQRRGGGQRSLANATLAGEEEMPGRAADETNAEDLEPGLYGFTRRNAATVDHALRDDDGRRGVHAVGSDVLRSVDLDDLDIHARIAGGALDDAYRALTLAAARPENLDLHGDVLCGNCAPPGCRPA